MSAESWRALDTWKPAIAQPPAEQVAETPGKDLPPPSDEQIQATDAVFSQHADVAAAGLFGFWSAGMLLHELQETGRRGQEDEKEKIEPDMDGKAE